MSPFFLISRAALAAAALAASSAGAQQHEIGHLMGTGTTSRSAPRPMENLSFNYTKIEYNTAAQSGAPSRAGGSGKVSYSDLHVTTHSGKSPAAVKGQ